MSKFHQNCKTAIKKIVKNCQKNISKITSKLSDVVKFLSKISFKNIFTLEVHSFSIDTRSSPENEERCLSESCLFTKEKDTKKPRLATMGPSELNHVSWPGQRLKSANDIVNGVAKYFRSINQRNYFGKGFSPNVPPFF